MTSEVTAGSARRVRSTPPFTIVARDGEVPRELWRILERDWPEVQVSEGTERTRHLGLGASRALGARLDADVWVGGKVDLLAFDRRVHRAEDEGRLGFFVKGSPSTLLVAVPEILTRYQRFYPRRNVPSDSPFFDEVLGIHRALHPLEKPLVRADWEHALDTWQWVLRLDPKADLAVQLAALLHDVERLVSEADARIEHQAGDYPAFKAAHAAKGAQLVRRILHVAEAWPELAERVVELVRGHERKAGEISAEAALLAEADALSFFSLNSPGFFAYFGRGHTAMKVEYTLGRMRAPARRLLERVRLVPAVADMVTAQATNGL